jgi:lipid-A-disaccharide synthase-like uncharacterized protein
MSDSLRSLLYPLGFIASFLFSLRVLFQWIRSEQKRQSHVSRGYWLISLSGNFIMTLHSFIQLQFPIALIQSLNGVISWRNLNLMKEYPRTTKQIVFIFMMVVVFVLLIFSMQAFFFHAYDWLRAPILPWTEANEHTIVFFWHIIGIIGMTVFASRYWIQWWMAEKNKTSILGKSFWWISLTGALLSIAYFIRIHDIVNFLGYSLGILPYIRNLFLLQKKPQEVPPLKNSLFFFAGEQSGDILGRELIRTLKE